MDESIDPFVESLGHSDAVRLLADAYPSFLSFVDRSYRYRFVNAAYVRFFSRPADEIVGRTVDEVWGRETFVKMKTHLDSALAGERVTYESEVDGTHRIATYEPFRSNGEVNGVLVFVQDVTELQQARAAAFEAERMASIGRLVTGLLHELNTPIGAVRSNAQTIEKARHRAKEALADHAAACDQPLSKVDQLLAIIETASEMIESSVTRVSDLVTTLEKFSATDRAEVQSTDVAAGVSAAVQLLRHQIGDRIEVVEVYEEVPEIPCRPAALNQVFLALLTNAVEALDGEGRIVVHVWADEDEINIAFEDSGRGIEPERLANIFNATFATGAARTKVGLGLMVSNNIVVKHNGYIVADSTVDVGTTMTVVLPLAAG